MGAGNRYRLLDDPNIGALYVPGNCFCKEGCTCWEDTRDNLLECILKHPTVARYGLRDDRRSAYYGELFIVKLECGYYNEIIIQLEHDCYYPDAMHKLNYEKCYHSLIKHINKEFVVYLGHGYTSTEFKIGEYGK